jgi:PAS domain S-box-containing protein
MEGPDQRQRIPRKARRASFRIAAIYAVVAAIWILFSDRLLLWYFEDPALLTRLQTAKGWFFVFATTLLLAWLIRRTTRKTYRESELLEEVISHIPIYIFWKDREGRYLGCNQRFASVAGVGRRENIVGKTDNDLAGGKEQADHIRRNDRLVMERGIPLLDVEETQLQADGKEATLLTSRVPLEDEAGNVTGMLGIRADITVRKREEEEIRESRDRAEAILRAALDGIVEIDEKGIITGWNPRAEEIFGWPDGEAVGRRLSETIIPPRLRQAHERGMQHFLKTGEGPILNRRIEVAALHRDGHEFPVEFAVTPIRRRGAYTFTAFIEEISERKAGEKALRESQKRFRDMVETINDWVWEVDRSGVYTYASPRVRDLLGYEPEEVIGKTPFDLMPEAEAERVSKIFREIVERREAFSALENTNLHKDGHPVVLETSGVPFFDEDQTLLGYRGVDRDITVRKKAEEALRESDRMKTEFVTTAAHEFRTPLTSIQGFSELLLTREDIPPGQRKEFLHYIHERAVSLAKIVADLLDIARIEAGLGLSLELKPYAVKDIFGQVKPFLETRAARHRLEITLTGEETLLDVDRGKMGQVLENIISNALKYSPEGGPVRVRGEPDREGYRITVSDRGIGMTPEQVARVFDKFYRADASHTAVEGVGLGMSIVKQIIEAFGGHIHVESALGKGTTVCVILPVACPQAKETT